MGFNREGVFITSDMVTTAASGNVIAERLRLHATLLTTINSTAFDNNPSAANTTQLQLGNLNYGLAPASMHNAPAGGPEIFVSTNGIGKNGTPSGGSSLRVTYETNVIERQSDLQGRPRSASPTSATGRSPTPPQPGDILDTYDTAITNAAWRNNGSWSLPRRPS